MSSSRRVLTLRVLLIGESFERLVIRWVAAHSRHEAGRSGSANCRSCSDDPLVCPGDEPGVAPTSFDHHGSGGCADETAKAGQTSLAGGQSSDGRALRSPIRGSRFVNLRLRTRATLGVTYSQYTAYARLGTRPGEIRLQVALSRPCPYDCYVESRVVCLRSRKTLRARTPLTRRLITGPSAASCRHLRQVRAQ